MRRVRTQLKQQYPSFHNNRHSSLQHHSEPLKDRLTPQAHSNNITNESKRKATRIELPFNSDFESTSTIFRPSFQYSLPPQKTNIKNLHEFMKKQAIIFRHKERILLKVSKKEQSSHLIDQLQSKIINMLKLQTKSQLIPHQEPLNMREKHRTEVVQLPEAPETHQNHLRQLSILNSMKPFPKRKSISESKKPILPNIPKQTRQSQKEKFIPTMTKKTIFRQSFTPPPRLPAPKYSFDRNNQKRLEVLNISKKKLHKNNNLKQ